MRHRFQRIFCSCFCFVLCDTNLSNERIRKIVTFFSLMCCNFYPKRNILYRKKCISCPCLFQLLWVLNLKTFKNSILCIYFYLYCIFVCLYLYICISKRTILIILYLSQWFLFVQNHQVWLIDILCWNSWLNYST